MTNKVENHDFIELDYTGKLQDGTVFDTTLEKVAKENQFPTEGKAFGPATICVGEQQILPGLDEELIGRELGKEFEITLPPEKAFGKRDVKKIEVIPISTFRENKMNPQPGLQFDDDQGRRGTVSRVAGGRVMVNYNHPLAGREVVYTVTVNRKVTDPKEKIASFIHTTLRMPYDKIAVKLDDKKATVTIPMQLPPQFTEAIGKKIAQLVGIDSVEFAAPKQ